MITWLGDSTSLKAVRGHAAATNEMQGYAGYKDRTSTTTDWKDSEFNTNGTSVVDVTNKEAGYQKLLFRFSLFNNDTVSDTVTIYLQNDDTSVNTILWQGTIISGGLLSYEDGAGWINDPLPSQGYAINVQALTSSPADGQTVYFGMLPKAPITTANVSKVYIPKAGRIKRAEVYCYSGTAGTNENWSLYVRINNTTDYLIATLGVSQSERTFQNAGLDIPVNAGDYFEIKGVQPTWATNPATTIYGGYVYIE